MSRRLTARFVLRCDASLELGMGHLVRCEALAEELIWRHGCEVRFALRGSDAAAAYAVKRGHDVIRMPDDVDRATPALVEAARQTHADAVVLDVRDPFPVACLASLRSQGVLLAAIDDESELRLAMDLVFSPPMPQIEALSWAGFTGTRHVGWEWVPLRREFAQAARCAPAGSGSLLVCMGGADPAGLTLQAIRALEGLDEPDAITVVVGDLFARGPELRALCARSRHAIAVQEAVTEMAALMRGSSLALASFGVLAYELAALGIPALHVSLTPDHALCAARFEEAGMARHAGLAEDLSEARLAEQVERLWRDREVRAAMSARARARVDGRGARRIAEVLVERSERRDG